MGWDILATALPAFIVGHAAIMMSWLDEPRKRLWTVLTVLGYGSSAACLVVGALWVIWS